MSEPKYRIETHGDQSPGYVAGDFTVNKTIVRQYNKARKKKWRPLDEINYPPPEDNDDCRRKYLGLLALHLHRAFKDSGYTQFVSLARLAQAKINEDLVTVYSLVSHQVKFTGALRRTLKYLWNRNIAVELRQKCQDDLNAELCTLRESWSFKVDLPFVNRFIPVQFAYDPDAHKIAIGPPPIVSTTPAEYPDKVRTTSELLTFLSSLLGSPFCNMGDIAWVKSYYPLFKLCLELLDTKAFRMDRIRINAENCEEWDYINTAADIEVRRYTEMTDDQRA